MIKAKLCHLFRILPLAALCLFPLPIQAQQDVESTGLQFDQLELQSELSFTLSELKPENPSSHSRDEALPEAAQNLISQLLENPYEEISQIRAHQFIGRLQSMQDDYTRSNRLEEASAIRNAIDELKSRASGVLPDSGNLTAYRGQNNRSINFEVVGRKGGSVWGSGVYTDDSDLGTAAVHTGLLRPGQRGLIRVTILPGNVRYTGSLRNGVASSDYDAWEGSYRVEAVSISKLLSSGQ